MRKGLFSKMAATSTLIIAVSFIIIASVLSIWFESYFFDQRKSQLKKESELIRSYAVDYVKNQHRYTDERRNDALSVLSDYSRADIWLVDSYGFVYSVSNAKFNDLLEKQVITKNDIEQLRANKLVDERGNYNEIFADSRHIYGMPLFDDNLFCGAVIMITPMSEINEPLKDVYKIIWTSAIFAIIISSIITYYFSQKIIIRPLAEINHVAGKISQGEVDKRVQINSNDEIGELAKSFNSMADNLERVEQHRREFVSNVSHEIRSPITSIKGFIGGILDGVIPKEREDYYLSIAYEETKRLTRLVNDLLDLSAIDSGRFSLKIEELDINELIRLAVLKFEPKVRDKKVNVEVALTQDSLLVAGDRDRLIQVITNLIDNAIKFVKESGNIKISNRIKGEKVLVSVFNDGPNIPEEDVGHIWDRFYRGDKARTSKVSTGLGLPIAKNILTQLGEEIWVENKVDEGVTFNFTLKKV